MPARSMASWIVLAVLAVLAVLQIILQLAFWGGLAGADVGNAWLFQAVGAALTILEIFMLVLASEYAAVGDKARARALRGLFVALALVNLAADLSAVSQFTGAKNRERGEAALHYQSLRKQQADAEQAVLRLRTQLQAMGLDRPSAALAIERDALAERAARYKLRGEGAPIRLVDQLAQIESAILVAQALEAKEQEQTRTSDELAKSHAPDDEAGSPFAALARLAHMIGLKAEAEDVRAVLAFAVALVVKLALTVGLWSLAPRSHDWVQMRAALGLAARSGADSVSLGGEAALAQGANLPPPLSAGTSETAPPLEEGGRRAPRRQRQPASRPGAIVAMFDAARDG